MLGVPASNAERRIKALVSKETQFIKTNFNAAKSYLPLWFSSARPYFKLFNYFQREF